MINFQEITDSYDWEKFCEEFLRENGYEIIRPPSLGQDTATDGFDLIVTKNYEDDLKLIWGVSCKHYAHSRNNVSLEHEKNIHGIGEEMVDGLIAFYSTGITSSLEAKFNKVRKNTSKRVSVFEKTKIERIIRKKSLDILYQQFFPESFSFDKSLSRIESQFSSSWKTLTPKETLESVSIEQALKYYRGAPITWNIARHSTIKRDIFWKIKSQIDSDFNGVYLITGAGGEGKTTLMMQLGTHYLDKKIDVHYIEDPSENILDVFKIIKSRKNLLLIDNVSDSKQLLELLKMAYYMKHIGVVMFSRENEWNAFLRSRKQPIQITNRIDVQFKLDELSETEIGGLMKLLREKKVLSGHFEEFLNQELTDNSRIFFLSFMMSATHGKSLDKILRDVVKKINKIDSTNVVLKSLATVVLIEKLGSSKKITCTKEFLIRSQNLDVRTFREVYELLMGELLMQDNRKMLITRNPVISEHYFNILFNSTIPYFEIDDICYDVIKALVLTESRETDLLMLQIPKYYERKGNTEFALNLYSHITSFGHRPIHYLQLVAMNLNKEYVALHFENLEKVYSSKFDHEYASKSWSRILNWILGNLELFTGDKKFHESFRKVSEEHSDPHFLLIWAKLELLDGNIGSMNLKGSAKWILKQSIRQNTVIEECYLLLSELVESIGDYKEEYSIRWILKSGMKNTNGESCYLRLAELEKANNNIGNELSINSAIWILNQGINNANGEACRFMLEEIKKHNK